MNHLKAALAVWKYCEETVEYLFGESTGDAKLDKLMQALNTAREKGLTRTEVIKDVFKRNLKSEEIDRIITTAKNQSLIKQNSVDGKVLYYAL